MAKSKIKFFIFSDESGSWHDPEDIYVRSWIVITEQEYQKLLNKVDEISSFIGSNELKWSIISNNSDFFVFFDNISFRIFITVSCAKNIRWDSKYNITKNFESSMLNFDFGELDLDIKKYVKERIYRDIKNALFLNFYEKYHIENAKNGIESVIKPSEYELIYRIDPPQMSKDGWKNVLEKINGFSDNLNLEFPKSSRSQGIQFADVIAGCFRSLLLKDSRFENAKLLLNKIKNRLIQKSAKNPNPNLIFFKEISEELKTNCADIWNY